MPNWCYNSEVIAGPKEQVKPLYNNLAKWIHDDICKNGFSQGWLGNIVGHADIETDENPDNWKYHCRGELVDEFDYYEEGNEGIIQFATETAWAPFPETWYAVLKKCAPDAKYYYMADEPNMGIYESNDINHRFFKEQFVVSYSFWDRENLPEPYLTEFKDAGDDMDWDWNEEAVIGMMQRITGTKETDFKKLLQLFEEKTEEDLGDSDNYINVYQIEYYDPEKE